MYSEVLFNLFRMSVDFTSKCCCFYVPEPSNTIFGHRQDNSFRQKFSDSEDIKAKEETQTVNFFWPISAHLTRSSHTGWNDGTHCSCLPEVGHDQAQTQDQTQHSTECGPLCHISIKTGPNTLNKGHVCCLIWSLPLSEALLDGILKGNSRKAVLLWPFGFLHCARCYSLNLLLFVWFVI